MKNENTVEKVLEIKVRYDDAIRNIAKYRAVIDDLKKEEAEYKKALKDKKISQEEYNAKLVETEKKMMHAKDVVQTLTKDVRNNIKIEKEQTGSLKQLRAQLSNLASEYDSLSEVERKASRGQELKSKINGITDSLKEAEGETQRFYRNVGNYEEAIKNALGMNNSFADSLLRMADNAKSGSGLFSNLKTEASAFGNTLTSLLKNKVFLGIAGIAGAGVVFKWWYDYNKGLVEATKLTRQFTDKSGDDLKAYRSEVQALADYYGKDFKEVLISANTVSKQFGITSEKALQIIKDGFIAGADANGEFLDSLKEYPAYFKEAGISADQFVAIIAETNKQGIFSDKGIDTIKEANIRLREMTDSTAAALEGIGLNSKKIQKELQSGSITTFEVMQLVSEKLNELPESSAAVGTAIADIFGEPGEDAGLKYIRTLKDISTNLDEVKAKAGGLGEVEEDLINSQTELTKEIALLFDVTGGSFEKMTAKVKTFVNDTLTDLIKTARGLFESVEDIAKREEEAAKQLGESVAAEQIKSQYDIIKEAQQKYIKQGVTEQEALKKAKEDRLKVLNLALKQEEKYLQETVNINEKYNKELKDASIIRQGLGLDRTNKEINQDINKSWEEYTKQLAAVESLKKQIESVTSYEPTGKAKGVITSAANIEAKKKEIAELRKAEDELLKLVKDNRKRQTEEIELQYSRQIEDLKQRIKTEEDLTPKAKEAINKQIISLEAQKQQALKKLSDEELQKELSNRQKLIELQLESVKKNSEKELELKLEQLRIKRQADLADTELTEEMKLAIIDKYKKKEAELIDAANKQIWDKQKKALKDRAKAELDLLESQNNIKLQKMVNEGASESQIKQAQYAYKIQELQTSLAQENEILDNMKRQENETEEEYDRRKIAQKQKIKEIEVQIETSKVDSIKQLYDDLINAIDALGEVNEGFAKLSKVIALGEIAVNTGKAIAAGVAQAQSVPFPGNIAAIATTVATILANIATAIKTVKSAKFATGGLVTGPGTGTSDSIPAQLSNGESVMTARTTELFAPILSSFNQMGGGVPINITASSNQTMGEDMLARAVAKGVQMMPNPVVSVTEINTVGKRVEVLENLESL
ncbi:hypothetical protein LDZ44_04515 [Bacteroides xylanisolvens]|uniref:Phage tail tape measure protein domain-containing protein n=2 Tax=Bacteroides TaxID=816 RepID=A0AAW4SQ16_9BACE|nr:phage tail tape measure protein [Bacteroides xylanisolvens]MCA4465848.1 hypothetical protein [Bacteroides xylanisolvens]MCA4470295.1 hypothetical protein [Bacteroides xylanisolvens]MCA4478209.1 hypothetical protein [Bacteroides xylanisolvens]MCA4487450.1 hypothetical protein [Bacteroides xylanisolvens]MCA4493106.1 hypothetical protein [Bacteroides xylanisolvens]